ncbi:MAG: DUF4258 domain-containing protein [Thermoplasmata archaeon]|nr:DUF4258 domain-containing protein [Thermoplasmata archaeon]
MACQLRPRPHFKERQIERGISEEEVRDAIFKGSKTRKGERKVHAVCGIAEVVYNEYPCTFILKRVHLATR